MTTSKTTQQFNVDGFLAVAFECGAKEGWHGLTPQKIAHAHDMGPLPAYLRHQDDIFILFNDIISMRVKNNIDMDESLETKDRLFDVLMEYFDAMDEYKDGLKTFFTDKKSATTTGLKTIPHFRRMIEDMLLFSGIDINHPLAEVKKAGLSVLYLKSFFVWLDDDSEDMGRTMAEIDKNLSLVEQAMNSLPFLRS